MNNSKPLNRTLLAALVGASLMAGCASAPKDIPELDQAHADVQTLQRDPQAQEVAAQELSNARSSLDAADAAMKKGNKDDVLHYSYLASQQAKTGEARVTEARSKAQVAEGEADRNRVLLEARTRDANAAKEEALASKAAAENLQHQLADLQAKQTDRGMVLTLGDVLFDTNKSTLKAGAATTLDRVAEFMAKNAGTKVMIEGHTDSTGSEDYNQELSQRRADAVATALESHGIDRSRVQPLGRGESLPVASNDNSAGRQQNRRVEIVFSDESGRFAAGSNASLR